MSTPLEPESLTWTALLGRWVEFAQASVALPPDAEGDRWRAAVPAIINLQAVTFALADLDRVATDERPLARDRADILIRRSARELDALWRGMPMPPSLDELRDDALRALESATYAGTVELVWPGPGPMVMPAVAIEPGPGSLGVMQPATVVMPGEPVAWWCGRNAPDLVAALPECRPEPAGPSGPRQVYRQLDADGRMTRDIIAPILADPQPGLPLLVPLFADGLAIGHFTVDADRWRAQQEQAMTGGALPVESFESFESFDQDDASGR